MSLSVVIRFGGVEHSVNMSISNVPVSSFIDLTKKEIKIKKEVELIDLTKEEKKVKKEVDLIDLIK